MAQWLSAAAYGGAAGLICCGIVTIATGNLELAQTLLLAGIGMHLTNSHGLIRRLPEPKKQIEMEDASDTPEDPPV